MLLTNKGKYKLLGWPFRAASIPTNFYIALCTSATAPTYQTNTLADLTQIATGNGYTDGGYQLTPGSTDFDVWTEDDIDNEGEIQVKDVTWTASGGTIPDSGDGARYAVLTDDNGTVANREVYAVWDLEMDRTVTDGFTLSLVNLTLKLVDDTSFSVRFDSVNITDNAAAIVV